MPDPVSEDLHQPVRVSPDGGEGRAGLQGEADAPLQGLGGQGGNGPLCQVHRKPVYLQGGLQAAQFQHQVVASLFCQFYTLRACRWRRINATAVGITRQASPRSVLAR